MPENLTVNALLATLDNHEERLAYYELLLVRDAGEVPALALPEGYHFATYRDGDKAHWLAIEKSAKELVTDADGEEAWQRYYAAHESELPGRMFFVVTDAGEYVATATAFYDCIRHDPSGAGWLHWVAVKREYQGRGLSKPLIAHTLRRLGELGYTRWKVPTQTNTWLAVKIYLDFGFRPIPENAEHSRTGWQIVKRLTNHPALAEFPPAPDDVMLSDGYAVRHVRTEDLAFWRTLDRHLTEARFSEIVSLSRGYILSRWGEPVGVMRYNLFWDEIPFANMVYLREDARGQGGGSVLMRNWEEEMRLDGFDMVMTSTQTDETAQHFYRKLGYRDAGGLLLDIPGHEQPMEMFFIKKL